MHAFSLLSGAFIFAAGSLFGVSISRTVDTLNSEEKEVDHGVGHQEG